MNHNHRTRTWAYALVSGLAIALAVALVAFALEGQERVTPAAAAASVQPLPQTPADRACIRVVARRSAPRLHRRDARARIDERTCQRLLASSTDPGFFLAAPTTPVAAAHLTANRSNR